MAICADLRAAPDACGVVFNRNIGRHRMLGHRWSHGGGRPCQAGSAPPGIRSCVAACWFGAVLNWFLGIAPLFCIRNDSDATNALAQTVDFVSREGGRLFWLGLGFTFLIRTGMARNHDSGHPCGYKAEFCSDTSPPGWVLLIMAAIALLYFAGADLLHLARLGTYASLAEDDAHPVFAPEGASPSDPDPAPFEPVNAVPTADPAER